MKKFSFPIWPRRDKSAQTAKDRLQILLAHERSGGGASPDFLPQLQRDIIEVIKRYMEIDNDDVEIRMERGEELSSLEINIEVPGGPAGKPRAAQG